MHRDAAIQRFEFTTEAIWKLAQLHLSEVHGLEYNSPKSVMRACFEVGLLEEDQTKEAIELLNDRNLTVHTYNEGLADTIYSRLKNHHALLSDLFNNIQQLKA